MWQNYKEKSKYNKTQKLNVTTQKLKMWHNLKTKNVTKLKSENSKCDKTQKPKIRENSKCDKTQKHQRWQLKNWKCEEKNQN